jgi:Staphylococcal nuclease homologue
VDAPETNQPQGPQSAQRLAQLLPRGAAVQLRTVELDRYGRTVAEVYRNNQSVNLQMVQEGRAVVYQHYLEEDKSLSLPSVGHPNLKSSMHFLCRTLVALLAFFCVELRENFKPY